MRSRKPAVVLAGVLVLLATGLGSIPSSQAGNSPASSSAIAALQARRAQLIAELAAMRPNLGRAGGAVGSAEAAFSAQQTRVLDEQNQLATLNARLLSLSGQLASNQATVLLSKHELAAITRATYETSGGDQMLAAVLSAQSFGQAMDTLKAADQVTAHVKALAARLAGADAAMRTEQASIQLDMGQAAALEGDLSAESDRLLAVLEGRNALLSLLRGPERQLAAEIAGIDNQIAADQAPPRVNKSGSCANRFAYGYCTWYVASRRCIPWLGNARDWYAAAAQMGYKEGRLPVAGAVLVFRPGARGVSSLGHVAYVEAVGPAAGIPAGSFRLSEMNFAGWNRVDYRILSDGDGSILGFIYGR